MPYPDADRLVTVARVYAEDGSETRLRLVGIDEWNRRFRTMRVAAHNARERVVRGAGPTRVMEVASVTGNFFEVLGVPAAHGVAPRLAAGDGRAVVSASLDLGPGVAIAGAMVLQALLDLGPRAPVVAIVDDMKYQGLAAPRAGAIYVPWPRVPTGVAHLVVRTTGDPLALSPAIRDLVRTLNPSLPVPEVRTLADHVAGTIDITLPTNVQDRPACLRFCARDVARQFPSQPQGTAARVRGRAGSGGGSGEAGGSRRWSSGDWRRWCSR